MREVVKILVEACCESTDRGWESPDCELAALPKSSLSGSTPISDGVVSASGCTSIPRSNPSDSGCSKEKSSGCTISEMVVVGGALLLVTGVISSFPAIGGDFRWLRKFVQRCRYSWHYWWLGDSGVGV